MVRAPSGVWKAAFKVCPLLGRGSVTKEWSKSRAALECANHQVDLGRWAPPVHVLPLCSQMHKFMGIE